MIHANAILFFDMLFSYFIKYFNLIVVMQSLCSHLAEKHVSYLPISSPPVVSIHQEHDTAGSNY